MKERSFNQRGNSWFGLVRIALAFTILIFGTFLFYVSTNYFDFTHRSGYLIGRPSESMIFFQFSVIAHLISASFLLLLTTFLIFFRIEKKWPRLHRFLGKTSVIIGLLILVPTGFYLSYHAMGGALGKILFFCLSFLTLLSLFNGYRTAINKSFDLHKRWMIRFYILLTSALWLRLNMFLLFLAFGQGEWQYLLAVILSWVPQLLFFELTLKRELNKSI